MQDRVISIRDVLLLCQRNFLLFGIFVLTGASIALFVLRYIPIEYQSKSTIAIQASYFRNPLVNELISEEHDPRELSAQRSSLIQFAISDEFLDSLAKQFDLYSESSSESTRSLERAELRKKIEYYSMGPSSFEINTVAPSAEIAASINSQVHQRIRQILYSTRIQTLENTHSAIEQHVRSLSKALIEKPKPKSERALALRNKLEEIRYEISSLLQHFTEKHPSIQKLRLKENSLERQLSLIPQNEEAQALDDPQAHNSDQDVFLNSTARASVKEIHSDLVKKLSNLNLVLAIEKDQAANPPYFSVIQPPSLPLNIFSPSKKKFLLFGALLGAVLGAFMVLLRELGREEESDMLTLFDELDLKLLGEVPFSDDHNLKQLPLLNDSVSAKRQLPRDPLLRLSHG